MNSKKKKKTNVKGMFWQVVISAVGIALILLAVGNLSLFFFGKSATANVETRRVGGAEDGYSVNQRYSWSVDYTFKDKDGKTVSGHTTRRGSDMSVKVEKRVYYFTFAPFINALESEAEPNIGQPIFIAIGIFLLFVMKKKKAKKKTKFKTVKNPNGEIDVPELDDYDDSVEEVFHNEE